VKTLSNIALEALIPSILTSLNVGVANLPRVTDADWTLVNPLVVSSFTSITLPNVPTRVFASFLR